MDTRKSARRFVFPAIVLWVIALVTAWPGDARADSPAVERLGEYILRIIHPEVAVVVNYKFAAESVGSDWMILDFAVTAPRGRETTIKREDIFVRTPTGLRVQLATQKAFREAYTKLKKAYRRAAMQRVSLQYFPTRTVCEVRMFVPPNKGVAFNEVSVDEGLACQGFLLFNVPGGVQSGEWVMEIDLEESKIGIPFTL